MAQLTDTIKYLDFTGLQSYDTLIKGVIAAGDEANSAELASAIGALDFSEIDASATGEAIVSISQTDGAISATKGHVAADKVDVNWGTQDPVSTTTSVQGALDELYGIVALNAEAGEVAVYADVDGSQTKVNTINEFGKTYTFKQGNTTIATMNLAKDMVVSGGSVITATSADTVIDNNVVVGQKYVKLTIANSTDILYIPVNDLYKDHTVEQNASKIQLAIDSNNVISADVVAGSIEKSDLTSALQNEISSAKTALAEKSTGHVTLTKTAGSGATPDSYTLAENDIASAALMGTLPSGITATTVTGYVAEVAGAAEDKATRITVNGVSQNASTGAIVIEGDDIAVKSGSGNIAAAQTNTDIAASDKIDVAFGKVLKKIADVDTDVTALETFVGNLTPISNGEITGLFPTT